ncbi:MAG: mobile mystery protein B [Acidobacteria bacterium]|nr:mobile mystery protein B [Acidobacteriota bacterium]
MIDALDPVGDGHTALSAEDRLGLIPTYIATRGELFEAEQRNISTALLRRPPTIETLLDDRYLRNLHRAMFDQVRKLAGRYRLRETNIGIAFEQIPSAVRNLVDDAIAWAEYTTYAPDEIAVRFHHRLVAIHAFPNGNGRHARIAADYLIRTLGAESFTWGKLRTDSPDALRGAYRRALQRADSGDITELVTFART